MRTNKKQLILKVALQVAHDVCLNCVTTKEVAQRVGCARNNIVHFFGTTAELHDAIVCEAVRAKDFVVIAQAVIVKNDTVNRASLELRKQAIDYLKDSLK